MNMEDIFYLTLELMNKEMSLKYFLSMAFLLWIIKRIAFFLIGKLVVWTIGKLYYLVTFKWLLK